MGGIPSVHLTSASESHSSGHVVNLLVDEHLMSSVQKHLTDSGSPLVQPDLVDETLEQKVRRLESTLAQERKEKWAAIELSEKRRVDLVNCEKLLKEQETSLKRNQTDITATGSSDVEEKHIEHKPFQFSERVSIDSSESPLSNNESRNATFMNFRTQLQEHRVARQQAIAAKTAEMNELRNALKREKAMRERLEKELSRFGEGVLEEVKSEQTENFVQDPQIVRLEQENCESAEKIKILQAELREMRTIILQQQNDLKMAIRKYDRLSRDSSDLEKQLARALIKVKEVEADRSHICDEHDREKLELAKRSVAMKNVIEVSKQMLSVRESQVVELKQRLTDIENVVAENKEINHFKQEYEKQLANIKQLKELYEDRMKLLEDERTKLMNKITEDSSTIDNLKEDLKDLTTKYGMVCEELDTEKMANEGLKQEVDVYMAQARSCERELAVMNGLLSQMLVGPKAADLDRLAELLHQHHALLTDMRDCHDCSLPRLLLDLAVQARPAASEENSAQLASSSAESDLQVVSYMDATVFRPPQQPTDPPNETQSSSENLEPAVQEILANLPKVWKVLSELLSQQVVHEELEPGNERTCYKKVDTPQGPKSVISVSNTFLRLKDLILEKNALQQELARLKHLNTHLETRLDDQEKRLSKVQKELHNTWGVVGRMRAQHQQLHTQETILRYELQEKRVMLGELRQELEYCRDKWDRARRKNKESEAEWKALRREQVLRRLPNGQDSAESGFSDSPDRSSTPSPVNVLDENISNSSEIVADNECPTDVPEAPPENRPEENHAIPIEISIESDLSLQETEPIEVFATTSLVDTTLETTVISTPPNIVVEHALRPSLLINSTREDTPISEHPEDISGPSTSMSSESIGEEIEKSGNDTHIKVTAEVETTETNKTSTDQTFEERMAARDERLRRLEDQCKKLVGKVSNTVRRGNDLVVKLDGIHEEYTSHENSVPETVTTETNGANKPAVRPEPEEVAREDEIRRLEEQCKTLVDEVSNTVRMENELAGNLDGVHEEYTSHEGSVPESVRTEGNDSNEPLEQPEPEELASDQSVSVQNLVCSRGEQNCEQSINNATHDANVSEHDNDKSSEK